jgi:potassium channel LctB
VRLLRELGYTNVRHYPGGLSEWFAADHPATPSEGDRPPQSARPGSPKRANPEARRQRGASARFIDTLAERSVASLFRWWIAIVVGGGIAYWLLEQSTGLALRSAGEPVGGGVRGMWLAIYFSAVTATSVGYGDIVPVGIARVVAIVESIAGLILFGCVVSKFVSRRQDALIGEIHHIAFEDRLGRVRTNLLLVRSELQATARLCEGRDMAPPEAMARVESAAMVFVGELHAVHDLLYRPAGLPDETVLEAILAGLVSVLREFDELLKCVQAQRGQRSPALTASITTMSRLAREICGDCVPRQFAPSLRNWMDEIQRIAGAVEQV